MYSVHCMCVLIFWKFLFIYCHCIRQLRRLSVMSLACLAAVCLLLLHSQLLGPFSPCHRADVSKSPKGSTRCEWWWRRKRLSEDIHVLSYSDGSNDSLTLNLSYESSSFDESIDDTIPLGTRPYLFEPKVISNKETTASSPQKSEMDDEERRENSEW